MSEAVLIFTFGPIQPFIAEARRTGDLRVGSQILANLAASIVRELHNQRVDVIYPVIQEGSAPNKIVAVGKWEDVDSLVQDVENNFRNAWSTLAKTAREELEKKIPIPDKSWAEIWDRQIGNFWEWYWAAARIDHQNYAEAYHLASQVLAARKRCRDFSAAPEAGIKDTLSGRRQALRTDTSDARQYWRLIGEVEFSSRVKINERLDAIGAVKRFSDLALAEENRFPSTSRVACADFLAEIDTHQADIQKIIKGLREDLQLIFQKHIKAIFPQSIWPYDGDLLYLSTLSPRGILREYGLQPDRADIARLREKLRTLYQVVGFQPNNYYAILTLDGDDIGKFIDKAIRTGDARLNHRRIGEDLAVYASRVPAIIQQNRGALVYNGGDDVLALLPLSTAVPTAIRLAEELSGYGLCASAGIAITHRLYPLGAALRVARESEQAAKRVRDKKTVCVTVLKRSGDPLQCFAPIQYLKNPYDNLIRIFQGDPQPMATRFIPEMASLVRGCAQKNPDDEKIFTSLVRYATKRHATTTGLSKDQDEILKNLPEQLTLLYKDILNVGIAEPANEVLHWIEFAGFTQRGGEA